MSGLVESVEQSKSISTLPQWHSFMKPLLQVLSDGNTWTKKDLVQATLEKAGITPEEGHVPPGGVIHRHRAGQLI